MRILFVVWGLIVGTLTMHAAAQFDMAAVQKWANAVVGEARFTNAPSQVLSANSGKATECPPPSVKGTYDHIDVTAVVPGPAGLALEGTRSYTR